MATEFEKYDPVKHGEMSNRGSARLPDPKWARLLLAARKSNVFVPNRHLNVAACSASTRNMLNKLVAADERISIRTLANQSGVVVRVLPR